MNFENKIDLVVEQVLDESKRFQKGMRKLLRSLADQGWDCRRTKNGHWRLAPPDKSKSVVFAAGTHSDYRGMKNMLADLKRNGAVLEGDYGF